MNYDAFYEDLVAECGTAEAAVNLLVRYSRDTDVLSVVDALASARMHATAGWLADYGLSSSPIDWDTIFYLAGFYTDVVDGRAPTADEHPMLREYLARAQANIKYLKDQLAKTTDFQAKRRLYTELSSESRKQLK